MDKKGTIVRRLTCILEQLVRLSDEQFFCFSVVSNAGYYKGESNRFPNTPRNTRIIGILH